MSRTAPPIPDRSQVRREITQAIGKERIAEWHKGSKVRDMWWLTWPSLAIIGMALAIGATGSWYLRVPMMVMQGFLIVNATLVMHSMCAHRKPFGGTVSRWSGTVLGGFGLISPSSFRSEHLHHHRYLGSPVEQDYVSSDLDRRWKRWVCASSLPGLLLTMNRKLVDPRWKDRSWDVVAHMHRKLKADPQTKKQIWAEDIYLVVFGATMIGLSFVVPGIAFWGYLVPLVVFASMANTVREMNEHFGIDLSNNWHITTVWEPPRFYRVFAHEAGSHHYVHHLWPNMPHYRRQEAWEAIAPLVTDHVELERSWFRLAWRYFVVGEDRFHWFDSSGERVNVPTLSEFADPDFAAAQKVAFR